MPLGEARLAAGPTALLVAMHLDPLTSDHARRLAELSAQGRPVVVVLSDPPEPLLPLEARAELAACLSSVTAVVTTDTSECDVDERAADLGRRQALIQHVWQRHALAAASQNG
jgi:hypothetical protein